MQYIIKIKQTYLQQHHRYMWSEFTLDKEKAQRFASVEDAEEVKELLLDPWMWRSFEREDVKIIPLENAG